MKKSKARAFFALLIISGLCILCALLGRSEFEIYFSFNDIIVFSWLSVFLIALPVIMIFPFLYFLLVIIFGKENAFKKMAPCVTYLKWIYLALVISGATFLGLYQRELISQGYIACKGIPSGWMPGMATMYVLDERQCLKSR